MPSPDLFISAKDLFIAAMDGKAPAINGRGKLAEGGEKLEFSPTPSASLESRTLVSRPDPVPDLVRSRQRFVRFDRPQYAVKLGHGGGRGPILRLGGE
jgi:hypothetical protein